MKYAVEALVPDCPEEPPEEEVGSVFDSHETEDIDEAKAWAWNWLEEGYVVRMWRR